MLSFHSGAVVGDRVRDRLDLVFGQAVFPQRLDERRALEPSRHLSDELEARAHSEDATHAVAAHVVEATAEAVAKDLIGHHQREKLARVGARQELRRDAVFHRIEVDRVEERAALAVHLVGSPGIRVVEVLGEPVSARDVPDQLATAENVPPEVCGPEGTREERADPDDRDPICLRSDTHSRPLRWFRRMAVTSTGFRRTGCVSKRGASVGRRTRRRERISRCCEAAARA